MKVDGLTGSIYQRGGVWWVKYRQHGRVLRESTGSAERLAAEKLLLKRNAAVEEGRTINLQLNRCKVSRLFDLVLTDYEVKQRKSVGKTRERLRKHLLPFFGHRFAAFVTSETVGEYIIRRQQAKRPAKPATINRELAILSRAFKLGRKARLVDQAPAIEKLPERNVRSGFFTRPQLEAVCAHLQAPLVAFFRFLYLTGWRSGEVKALQWRHVDFEAQTIRLDAGTTKNDEGRVIRFTAEVGALLEAQRAYTDAVNRDRGALCQHVFHRNGKPLVDYYDAWRRACLKAGLATKDATGRIKAHRTPHDFRRSAARNLIRAGVHQTVARAFTGHKTESIFTRYNITAEADLIEATERLDRYQQDEAARLSGGHNLGTIGHSEPKTARAGRAK
ncbi:tyrosine-type recombinase/integrase [bacterium]|nr:tyrosine-type recombinase/integrase [bacterium]